MTGRQTPAAASTALFVPGDRPERFAKAAAAGAGFVILDLEDAVGSEHKSYAREQVLSALTDPDSSLTGAVRINAFGEGGEDDLAPLIDATRRASQRLDAVLVPKAEDPRELAHLHEALGGTVPIVALVETATGLFEAGRLAAEPGVIRLAFGALDFGVDVDSSSPLVANHARIELVLASRRAGIAAPFDSPNPEFRDTEQISRDAAVARALGFGGQLCIHPKQVPIVSEAFRPSSAEIEWARSVTALGAQSAAQLDGRMVDRPVFLRAQRILERSGTAEQR